MTEPDLIALALCAVLGWGALLLATEFIATLLGDPGARAGG
jgi:hypothetical protein